MCSGAQRPTPGRVELTPYVCPWCRGAGRWASGERCMDCHGLGVTDKPAPGVDMSRDYPPGQAPPEQAAARLPRPPAVMKASCLDCAFRPGSPEGLGPQQPDGDGIRPDVTEPFYCHHGMATKTENPDDYAPAAWLVGRPLGYFVCAGWWDTQVEGRPPDEQPYRDIGGGRTVEFAELPPTSLPDDAEVSHRATPC